MMLREAIKIFHKNQMIRVLCGENVLFEGTADALKKLLVHRISEGDGLVLDKDKDIIQIKLSQYLIGR